MSKQTINIGASPNDGTGTPLRTSFDYTNQNFTELYTALGGGVGLPGATTQVIFNDGGTNLAGDAGLVYNKTTDALTVAGLVTAASATITGDLTVRTNKLAVTSNGVGVGTANPTSGTLSVQTHYLLFSDSQTKIGDNGFCNGVSSDGNSQIQFYGGKSLFFNEGASNTKMTLNSTGLGVGDVPAANTRLTIGSTNATGFQYALRTTGITTGRSQIYLANTSGDLVSGLEGSVAGASITGSAAYSAYIGTATSNPFYLVTGGSVRATVDTSGNLGIGVTPSAWAAGYKAIQIAASQSTALMGSGNQTELTTNAFFDGAWEYHGAGTVAASRYSQRQSGVHYWYTAAAGAAGATITDFATAKMTLDASGNLLVGTTDTSSTSGAGFKIIGSGLGPYVVNAASSNSALAYTMYSTGAAAYRFYVGWGGTVFATNTVISAISDARLKENVQDIDVGLGAILALKPRKFDWKEGKGKDIKGDRGFIAQEFEQVFPQLVDEWADPAPEGEAPYKSVRQDLIPVLVKAIQELTARVQTLETR